jgi:hypothetical protein
MNKLKIGTAGLLYGKKVVLITYPGTNRIGWAWADTKKPITEKELEHLEKQKELKEKEYLEE